MLKTRPFDIAELLETENDVQAFVHEAAQSGSAADFVHALGIAARAKGMSQLARDTGLGRDSEGCAGVGD